jgi:pantoate--beta-alanine ligase
MSHALEVFESIAAWKKARRERLVGSLGFVPTMGALHEGHLELVRRSKRENSLTLVSIFVNPTQFNDPKDLEKYPRTFEADRAQLEKVGADAILCPRYEELYADQYRYRVSESELSGALCGAHRPGHFDGVLSVVLKLLNIAQAERAYFGEKDFQQLSLIRGMVEAFFVPTEIVACPTVREADGLAMSSRNTRLSAAERERAALFPRILKQERSTEQARVALERAGFEVDYVEDRALEGANKRRFGAVRIGEVRLIDNLSLESV